METEVQADVKHLDFGARSAEIDAELRQKNPSIAAQRRTRDSDWLFLHILYTFVRKEMMKRAFLTAALTAILTSVPAISPQGASTAKFLKHQIHLAIDVPNHQTLVQDDGLVRVEKGWNLVCVAASAKIESLLVDGASVQHLVINLKDTAQLPPEIRSSLPIKDSIAPSKLLFFKCSKADSLSFYLTFSAIYDQDVKNVRFSREAIGSEVSGTISDAGAYLSSGGLFYPQGSEKQVSFEVTADIPVAWSAVSDGNRTGTKVQGERKIESFANPFASDGCTFMAAPYVVKSTQTDGIEVACYFFAADTGLAESYLKASADYIKMYSELIGRYPFHCFTVAENFFPTGYGMPAWTLLGQAVIRLPFIISSSLGHEVLHNWWGNSVYVDYDSGNWCEGLTVYGADYRYKLNESAASARQYRKDILKEYLSYVSSDKDFPLRSFKSRTSASTRSVGYNKAMMVFHMIEDEIGTKAFFDAWKLVYRTDVGKEIAWEDWIKAFESTSGRDLTYVIPQWIDRTGAPTLGLGVVGAEPSDGSGMRVVHLKLLESSEPAYRLLVRVRADGPGNSIDTVILLNSAQVQFDWKVPSSSVSISADPEFDLFRRLYPEEVEPIVSASMGAPKRALISFGSNQQLNAAFESFGDNLSEDSMKVEPPEAVATLSHDLAPILLNPVELPEYLTPQIRSSADSLTIGDTTYARAGHTFVLAGKDWKGFEKYLVVISEDSVSLPRLGQLVPHYGKYSYLVFEGSKNVGKGQWEAGASPLRISLSK